jgi:hypothetical protein
VADTITVTYKVNEDGSLSKITQKAEAAAKATDKAAGSSNNYSKKQKGVAGATSNSTKAFSKMTQGITGGLVPAYAALAANVFAISAAFNFLKRAADVKILEEGQISFGKNTGFALQTVTAGLREASGGMLGFREAAEAAAIGVAKGFSPKQLEDLAVGAKKASSALGRNFEDSFDRLIRGASKAEPELLDELGITLKLADATEKYAEKVGKTAKSLTAFERSQAVLLETQRQLDVMYGQMEGKSNPFVELSKTFEDLVKAGTNFLMPLFEGIAKIINGSAIAAIAVFGVIGLSIVKTMVPLDGLKKGFAAFKMSSQESMAHAINDQMSYRAELEKTKAAVQASKAQGVSGAAKSLGGPSKLVQKAAAGNLTDPKQIGQLKAHLKKAETEYRLHGEIRKGVFKGADLAQIQSLKGALNTMGKDHMSFFQRQKMRYKSMTLHAKVAYSKIASVGTKALSMVGAAATRMGGAMNKAMKMAGFIGMFMMIIEIGQQLMQAPMKIVMSVLRGVDFIIKGVLKGIGMAIDFIGNVFKGMINALIAGYNKVGSYIPGFKEMEYLNASSTAATDAMENLGDSVINLAEGFKSSGLGQSLQDFEDRRIAAAEEAEAYKNLKTAIKDTGTELNSILEGRKEARDLADRALETAKKEGKSVEIIEEKTAAIKALVVTQQQQAATTIGTIGAAGLLRKAMAIKDDDKKANALKLIKEQLEGMGALSPAAIKAINEMDVGALEAIELSATNAHAGIGALKDGINNLSQAMGSGDLSAAENALQSLGQTADATSGYFKELFGEDSVAAQQAMTDFEESFTNAGTTASAFLERIVAIRKETERLAVVTASASLVQGQYAATFNAQLGLENADNLIKAKQAQIDLENDETSEAGKRLALEMKLLQVARDKANVTLVTATQGEGMGNGVASSAIADAGGGAQAQLSPFLGTLEKLGPEGELISSVVNGAFAIQDAFSNAFAEIDAGGLSLETGLATAAASVQVMSSIMASSSKSKIAAIDAEIAAEQKRDGKSAGSVAKIASMEKKKLAAQKKAFEVNKKMQMAQIAISTAAAMVSAAQAAAAAAAVTGPAAPITFASVFAGIGGAIAAIGAASIAIVAGTSFGGGGGGAANAPAVSGVSVGNRQNSVDLAKARSPSGELGYARGESGTGGGMTNFKPAFSGYKHRAGGGYVVGEQGPEVFMPETAGEIIPSGQSTGGNTNVNFSINAVDAAGVEELLMTQRGNIIGMIRESANAHGEMFLEGVDIMSDSADMSR